MPSLCKSKSNPKASIKAQRRRATALAGLCLISFLGCIDFTSVNTVLPSVQKELHIHLKNLQWIISILFLVLSTMMIVVGRLADLYGRVRAIHWGMLLLIAGSLTAALANTFAVLLIGRIIQGIAISIFYTVPVALLSDMFDERHQAKATGILIGFNGLGLALGPIFGGLISTSLGWRYLFYLNIPLVMISYILCHKQFKQQQELLKPGRIDYNSVVILVLGLPLLIYSLVNLGPQKTQHAIVFFITLTIATILLIAFYCNEKKLIILWLTLSYFEIGSSQ